MSVVALRAASSARHVGFALSHPAALFAGVGGAYAPVLGNPGEVWRRVAAKPAPQGAFLGSWVLAIMGQLVIALGVSLLLQANLGAVGWDTLHAGIAAVVGVSIGQAALMTAGTCLVVGMLVGWRPTAMVVVAAAIGAVTVDAVVDVLPAMYGLGRWAAVALGSVVLATGAGTYLGAGAGESAHDVPLALVRRTGLPIGIAALCVTLTTTSLGLALGGPIGPATPLIAGVLTLLVPRVVARVEQHKRSWLPEVIDVTELPLV